MIEATKNSIIRLYLEGLKEMVTTNSTFRKEEDLLNIYKYILMTHLRLNRFVLLAEDRAGVWVEKVSFEYKGSPEPEVNEYLLGLDRSTKIDPSRLPDESPLRQFSFVIPTFVQDESIREGPRLGYKTIAFLLIGGIEEQIKDNPNLLLFLEIVTYLANLSVYNRRLQEMESNSLMIQREMELAAAVQDGLYPKNLPETGELTAYASKRAQITVSGDYYDLVKISPTRYLACIADVSGKGFGAAILMANFQASLHTMMRRDTDLPALVHGINHIIKQNSQGEKFVTAFFVLVDLGKKTLEYVNAGHHPPVLILDGYKPLSLSSTVTILGIFDELPEIKPVQHTFEEGFTLFTYTDGLVETFNPQGEEFGMQRMENFVLLNSAEPLDELHKNLIIKLDNFRQERELHDDVTLFSLRVTYPKVEA